MLHAFCDWLSQTPVSLAIQNAFWVIPAFQSVHIMAIAVVMAGMAMLDLRLLGVAGRQPVADMARRFLPWTWRALVVLLVTGVVLIIGEPARELLSPAFQAKMVLLILAVIVTLTIQRRIARDASFGESQRGAATLLAVTSLVLWIAIIAAGRWIAYVEAG